MAGPKDFSFRLPVAAGLFYPGEPQACRDAASALLRSGSVRDVVVEPGGSRRGWGGIVPHAGWMCSGAIAGQVVAELARLNADGPPEVVVVFGAVHTPLDLDRAALDLHETWMVPGGETSVDTNLTRQLGCDSALFVSDDRFHRQEHAVEVELPLLQAAWPKATLLPIEVPLIDSAERIGRETAQRVLSTGKRVVFLASSDFTHYGPAYRFVPAGIGVDGLRWALQNDDRLLKLIADFEPRRIVPEVRERKNACGGGAIAAMLAACREAGATRVQVLRHANSYQMLNRVVSDDPTNAVGYAGVIVT